MDLQVILSPPLKVAFTTPAIRQQIYLWLLYQRGTSQNELSQLLKINTILKLVEKITYPQIIGSIGLTDIKCKPSSMFPNLNNVNNID